MKKKGKLKAKMKEKSVEFLLKEHKMIFFRCFSIQNWFVGCAKPMLCLGKMENNTKGMNE